MNEITQAFLLLSGPVGAAAVWWFKRRDDAKRDQRIRDIERDHADCERKCALRDAEVVNLTRELTEQRGAVATLTALLKREISLG